MTLFVFFVFGAIIIGAGAMLAPAMPTRQPRIGLAATLALGLVIGGAVFWASLFGWDTLVVDYLMFALVTSIFLFGTLSYGQKRAEDRGEELSDADQGWTSLRDLLLFTIAALIFLIPALSIPVPLDTDAQGFGYLGLMAKFGGGFASLAPFQPEIQYLYSPGFTALIAYLSQQLNLGMHLIQLGVGAVAGLLNVWLAYDMGSELRDKRLGRAMALAMLGGFGLFFAAMDSHYTTLLALLFAQASLIFMFRYLRDHLPVDLIGAGLMVGAVAITHPDTTIILGLGIGAWMLSMWLATPRPTLRLWVSLLIGVPVVAVIAISPWLASIVPLLGAEIVSPFERSSDYLGVMVFYHGVVILPFVLIGAINGISKRDSASLLAVGWLLLILDFSTTGILEGLFPGLLAPILRYDYPFSIAWHGPILPYTILGGRGLLWLWDTFAEKRWGIALHRWAPIASAVAIVLALGAFAFNTQILAFSKGRVAFFGAFSSVADVEAMTWLKDNTPADARVLNHPGPHEGDWVPVISERETVFYRWQPFFRGTEESLAEQDRFLAFWRDPSAATNVDLLREAGVDYVIVPQIITDPASLETAFRWRPPLTEVTLAGGIPDGVPPYLELVFDREGAQVYRVIDAAAVPAP